MIKKFFLFLILIPQISWGNKITNPVADSGITSISGLLEVIIAGVTYLAIPLIVLAFIYSGFKFVSAQGDSTAIAEAKRIFGYTIAATAIILGSNVILEVVTGTAKDLMSLNLINHLIL